jgi:hypothetical protein
MKHCLIVQFGIASLGAVLIYFFNQQESLLPVFIVVGRVGLEGAINIYFLSITELFPTLFKTTAFGIQQITLRILCLYLPIVAEMQQPIPILVFLCLQVVGTVTSFGLKIPSE